jgi:hypothetical protein
VHRDAVAYVAGCDIPVWRLEMARRAGSGQAALVAAFPDLTPAGVDVAFAYGRRNCALGSRGVNALRPQCGSRCDHIDVRARNEPETLSGRTSRRQSRHHPVETWNRCRLG